MSMPTSSRPPRARALRVEVDVAGVVEGTQRISGVVRDLSLHGLFLSCRPRLPLGEELTVRFTVPLEDGQVGRVEARAEVRHRGRGRGLGLRFLRLSHENAAVIQRYLHARVEG